MDEEAKTEKTVLFLVSVLVEGSRIERRKGRDLKRRDLTGKTLKRRRDMVEFLSARERGFRVSKRNERIDGRFRTRE